MSSNEAYIKNLIGNVRNGTETGMRKAVIYAQGEAQKLAMDRIYSKPVKGNYVRTGLYKSTIKGTVEKAGGGHVEGKIQSPVVYAKHLEFKCQYMCLTDAVLNNRQEIVKLIQSDIKGASK